MNTERRTTKGSKVEVREAKSGPGMIVGHAAVFYDAADPGTRYMLWDDIEERIMPGAFDRAIREKQDVRSLFNHESSQMLGRTSAGTLRLAVDARGLAYEADAPDTAAGRDVVTLVKRGDVTGSSFMFRTVKDTITRETRNGRPYYIRQLEDVDLFDASPVTFPAYDSADAGARSAIVSRAVPTAAEAEAEAAAVRAKAPPPEAWRAGAQSRQRRLDIAARE